MMSNLLNNLESIREELKVNRLFSRDDLFEECITKKLNDVVRRYNKELDEGSEYLLAKDPESVLKSITRMQKIKDREILSGYLNSYPISKEDNEDEVDDND